MKRSRKRTKVLELTTVCVESDGNTGEGTSDGVQRKRLKADHVYFNRDVLNAELARIHDAGTEQATNYEAKLKQAKDKEVQRDIAKAERVKANGIECGVAVVQRDIAKAERVKANGIECGVAVVQRDIAKAERVKANEIEFGVANAIETSTAQVNNDHLKEPEINSKQVTTGENIFEAVETIEARLFHIKSHKLKKAEKNAEKNAEKKAEKKAGKKAEKKAKKMKSIDKKLEEKKSDDLKVEKGDQMKSYAQNKGTGVEKNGETSVMKDADKTGNLTAEDNKSIKSVHLKDSDKTEKLTAEKKMKDNTSSKSDDLKDEVSKANGLKEKEVEAEKSSLKRDEVKTGSINSGETGKANQDVLKTFNEPSIPQDIRMKCLRKLGFDPVKKSTMSKQLRCWFELFLKSLNKEGEDGERSVIVIRDPRNSQHVHSQRENVTKDEEEMDKHTAEVLTRNRAFRYLRLPKPITYNEYPFVEKPCPLPAKILRNVELFCRQQISNKKLVRGLQKGPPSEEADIINKWRLVEAKTDESQEEDEPLSPCVEYDREVDQYHDEKTLDKTFLPGEEEPISPGELKQMEFVDSQDNIVQGVPQPFSKSKDEVNQQSSIETDVDDQGFEIQKSTENKQAGIDKGTGMNRKETQAISVNQQTSIQTLSNIDQIKQNNEKPNYQKSAQVLIDNEVPREESGTNENEQNSTSDQIDVRYVKQSAEVKTRFDKMLNNKVKEKNDKQEDKENVPKMNNDELFEKCKDAGRSNVEPNDNELKIDKREIIVVQEQVDSAEESGESIENLTQVNEGVGNFVNERKMIQSRTVYFSSIDEHNFTRITDGRNGNEWPSEVIRYEGDGEGFLSGDEAFFDFSPKSEGTRLRSDVRAEKRRGIWTRNEVSRTKAGAQSTRANQNREIRKTLKRAEFLNRLKVSAVLNLLRLSQNEREESPLREAKDRPAVRTQRENGESDMKFGDVADSASKSRQLASACRLLKKKQFADKASQVRSNSLNNLMVPINFSIINERSFHGVIAKCTQKSADRDSDAGERKNKFSLSKLIEEEPITNIWKGVQDCYHVWTLQVNEGASMSGDKKVAGGLHKDATIDNRSTEPEEACSPDLTPNEICQVDTENNQEKCYEYSVREVISNVVVEDPQIIGEGDSGSLDQPLFVYIRPNRNDITQEFPPSPPPSL